MRKDIYKRIFSFLSLIKKNTFVVCECKRKSLSMSDPHHKGQIHRRLFFLRDYVDLRHILLCKNWGSSVSIVSDYGLDDQATGVWSPAKAKDFSSSLCIQTGFEAHPACYPVGTGAPLPGGKVWPGHYTDHSPPSSAKVKNE
jgi:hypothetical protein